MIAVAPASAGAQTLSIVDSTTTDSVTTFVYDGIGGAVSGALNPTSLPFSDTSSSVDGAASSDVFVDLSSSALRFDFSLARAAGLGSFGQVVTAVEFFSDADVDFVASGDVTVVDPDGRRILLFADLFDATSATSVFQHFQESQTTPNESCVLGGLAGDFQNSAVGNLSGTLVAGHHYLLQINVVIETNAAPAAATASASGSVGLDFFPLGVVPPDADRFLTFLKDVSPGHAEDRNSAVAYYATIDPNDRRLTLDDWLVVNGFDTGATASAVYVNDADLGFGRNMYVKTHPDGRVASYVVNHGDATIPSPANPTADPVDGTAEEKIVNIHNGQNVIATVAMEYGPPDADPGAPYFTTFYAYAPDGTRIELADLDGRGAKAIPGACNVCHGGSPRPVLADGRVPSRGDTGAGFLPWDLDTFSFSDTLYGGLPIYSRASQESDFKALNAAVLLTNPNATTQEIVEGWYGGAGLPAATFDGNVVPAGWTGHEAAYREVFAPNCRNCHMTRSPALAFQTYGEFAALQARASHLVFDRSIMPLARRTYDRFWTSFPGTGDAAVQDLFGLIPATRRPGSGSPLPFAGPDGHGAVGLPKQLDAGDSSYATSFVWSPTSAPAGSTAALDDPLAAAPVLVPDFPGVYGFELTATNGAGSATDSVTLTVTSDGSDSGVDFERDVFPLFETRCESCHDGSIGPDFLGGATSQASRVQKAFQSFSSRADVMEPPQSLLIQKAGGFLGHGGGVALSDPVEASLVVRWIDEGARRSTSAATYRRIGIVLPVTLLTTAGIIHPYDGIDLAPGALLDGEDLGDANLLGANLVGVSAIGTRYAGAILLLADLSGADLSGADLGFANVTGATFAGAFYDENTIFPSGAPFDVSPWGLPGDATPWGAGMIPVPEPGFATSIVMAACGLVIVAAARRRSRGEPQARRRFDAQ